MTRAKVLGMAAVLAGSLGLATATQAAPYTVGPLGVSEAEVTIERVAGGCGPGWHPNPWGECRPNRRPPYWGRGYDGYRPPPPPVYGYYGRPRRFYY